MGRLPVTGALLAGGRGVRLGGVLKAELRSSGERLLDRSLRFLGELCAETWLLPGPNTLQAPGTRSLADALPDRGPPGALLAALEASGQPHVFALAVDMPQPSRRAALELFGRLGGADAAVFTVAGRIEPLFGFYATRCAAPFRRQLAEGSQSFAELLRPLRCICVPAEELPEGGHFLTSVNTPEEAGKWGLR